jgi:hypothetical protein
VRIELVRVIVEAKFWGKCAELKREPHFTVGGGHSKYVSGDMQMV